MTEIGNSNTMQNIVAWEGRYLNISKQNSRRRQKLAL